MLEKQEEKTLKSHINSKEKRKRQTTKWSNRKEKKTVKSTIIKKDYELINPAAHDQDLLSGISFVLIKVRKGLAGDCIKNENNGDIVFKQLSIIYYLDKIKKYLDTYLIN